MKFRFDECIGYEADFILDGNNHLFACDEERRFISFFRNEDKTKESYQVTVKDRKDCSEEEIQRYLSSYGDFSESMKIVREKEPISLPKELAVSKIHIWIFPRQDRCLLGEPESYHYSMSVSSFFRGPELHDFQRCEGYYNPGEHEIYTCVIDLLEQEGYKI